MSYDLTLPTVCNHRIYRELVELDEDRRSLRMSKPLASAASIKVYASDNLVSKTEYTIIYDPRTLTINQPRMVRFNQKWKATEDFFEITYVTISGYCPKCVGLNELDDISYNVKGQVNTSRNEKLLLQNLEKFTVTELGSNPFHTFIGTGLVDLLGKRISDFDFVRSRISQEIGNTLSKLKEMQKKYIQTGRPMTAGEQLDKVLEIKVEQDTEDPTIARADITVTALSGQTVNYSQYLRVIQS